MVLEYFTVDMVMLVFGISGALAVGLNYILEALNKLSKDHKVFSWVNLYASIALLTYSWYGEVWLFVGLNLFLSLVGIFGLYEVYFKTVKFDKEDF